MTLAPFDPDVRDRDVIVFSKGPSFTVQIDATLKAQGWAGGQGVQWSDDPNSDTFIVTVSAGLPGGFLLWGANETADQFISYTQNQPTYSFATYCFGPWTISTRTYEIYTHASRMVGPLVPITYVAGQPLFFSLRGLFTNEDESSLGFVVGAVMQVPSASLNQSYLGVSTQT
jgi:hypothetical protein